MITRSFFLATIAVALLAFGCSDDDTTEEDMGTDLGIDLKVDTKTDTPPPPPDVGPDTAPDLPKLDGQICSISLFAINNTPATNNSLERNILPSRPVYASTLPNTMT